MVVEDGHPEVADDARARHQNLEVRLRCRGCHQPVPAMDDAGERLAQRPGLQGHGGRQQEDLLCRHHAVLGTASISKHAAGVPTASVLTEVDLTSRAELTAVAGPVGVDAHSVPGPELPGRHLPHLDDGPCELVTQRHLLRAAHRELALDGRQVMERIVQT